MFFRSNRGSAIRRAFLLLAPTLVAAVLVACGGQSNAQKATTALNQGLAAHNADRLDEAAADYRKVLQYDPQNKYAFFDLGVIYHQQGDTVSAENNYRLCLSIDPNFTSALFNLALIRSKAGSNNEAIDLYRKIITLDPKNAAAHLNLGVILVGLGFVDDGNNEIRTAGQLDPKYAQPLAPTPPAGSQNPANAPRTPVPAPAATPTRTP
jgi:Flp pilus assembly protein TadD